MRVAKVAVMVALAMWFVAGNAEAQNRQVGRKGATSLALDVSVSARQTTTPVINSRGQFVGTEQEWTGDYNGRLETGKFLADPLVLTVGFLVGGQIGGGGGVFSGLDGGLRLYMTPRSLASPYVSGGGGVVTFRGGGSTSSFGSAYGAAGLEAAVRDNATLFFEGRFERQFADGGGTNGARFGIGLRVLF
jgi:hypothetical protein